MYIRSVLLFVITALALFGCHFYVSAVQILYLILY